MLHSDIVAGDVHYIQQWSVADNTARDALTVGAGDVGKVCQVTGTAKFYILSDDIPMTWVEIGGSGGAGDVVGPASATDNAIVRFDSTTGKLIQDSGITIADGASGTLSGTNTGDQSLFSTIAVSGQSNVVADTTSDTLTLVAGTNVTITTDAATDSITINASGGGGSSTENLVLNGGFTINQRVYSSGATLASGSYGHDRWKAGSNGGDYSFTQLNSNTTITIAANKSLIQVIEDKNIQSTSYTLSWAGTCQARYAVNSATPSGSYASSPISITGQTAGSTLSIEFSNGASSGTLGEVVLVAGATAQTFSPRIYSDELDMCQRYYVKGYNLSIVPGATFTVGADGFIYEHANSSFGMTVVFPVRMRAAPTVTTWDAAGNLNRFSYFAGSWLDNGIFSVKTPAEMICYFQHSQASAIYTNFQFQAEAEL